VYLKNNFIYEGMTEPVYRWSDGKVRYNKHRFQKKKLIGGFDSSKTTNEIMSERGFLKCYDSGNLKYIFNFLQ